MKLKLKEPIKVSAAGKNLQAQVDKNTIGTIELPAGTIFEFEEVEINERGTLNYDLSDIYQKQKFMCAIKGAELKNAIDTLYDGVFRPAIKYGSFDGAPVSDNQRVFLEKVWEKVNTHFADVDFENEC